ncbi:MAG: YggS family pyridoxal phosphate enzyme [Conexibacteraceae bacterium]|nr:YggS family pyridoxal phosphate enzyme [Conexibacteraceae bacterium]
MVDLIHGLLAADVEANLAAVHQRIADAGRAPGEVQILAAVKYLPAEELAALAQGGVTLAGENRAQELVVKAQAHPEFTWDFIGALQSRKVPLILPHVRYIHSVATDSALAQLRRHGTPETRILVEVNVAGDPGKAGVTPAQLPGFLERCPVRVAGLMTMPPLAADPEDSRAHFASLRELAQAHGLHELSMGTSQDYGVAVEEGATIIRLGSALYRPGAS